MKNEPKLKFKLTRAKTSAKDRPGGKRNFIMKIKDQHNVLRIAMDTVESIHKIKNSKI